MLENLLDTDGENRAVRGFLLGYSERGVNIGDMRSHLQLYDQPYWPEWVERSPAKQTLTKAGAQAWLRYLFGLEKVVHLRDFSAEERVRYHAHLCTHGDNNAT